MIVKETGNEQYEVIEQRTSARMAGPFDTSAGAWRWIDRQSGEPISPAEKKSEWVTDQIIGGGGR